MSKFFNILVACILFVGVGQSKAQNKKVKPNHIGIYPFTIIQNGIGMGAYYERNINEKDKINVIIPIKYVIQDFGSFGVYSAGYKDDINYIEFAPGLKFYVGNAEKKVNYAVGPSLYYNYSKGFYKVDNWSFDEPLSYGFASHSLGLLINNYLNINIIERISIGLELGLGVMFYGKSYKFRNTQTTRSREEMTQYFNASGQFSISLGFRF